MTDATNVKPTTLRLKVWYAATPENQPQVFGGQDPERAEYGAGAFIRDMGALGGQGVRRVCVEIENGGEGA